MSTFTSFTSRSAGRAVTLLALPLALATPGFAQTNRLTNGNFENGLSGWTIRTRITGDKYDPSDPQAAQGSYYAASYADSRPQDAGTQFTTPISQLYSTPDTSALTGRGNGFAVSDMNAPGTQALYQNFTATAADARISWSQYVYDWSGFDPAQAAANNQFARVDLLLTSAITTDPFTTNIVGSLYGPAVDPEASLGLDPRWRNYSISLGNLVAGQSYALRFLTTDTQFVANHAVDNASVITVPEPTTASLAVLPLTLIPLLYCRRSRAPLR